MPDLTTLNPAQPPDTEAVALGASRMREERTAIITSMDKEHSLDGRHQIPGGQNVDRAAPDSIDGRLFRNLERGVIEQSIAGLWAVLHAGKLAYQFTAGAVALPNATWVDVASVTVDSPLGGTALLIGCASLLIPTVGGAQSSIFSYRHVFGASTVLDPQTGSVFVTHASGNNIPLWQVTHPGVYVGLLGLSEGSHTFRFQVQNTASLGSPTAVNRFLAVLIV